MSEAKRMVIMASEGTFEKGMMAMTIANTAASMGMEVHMFFTYFGLNLLKRGARPKLPGTFRLFTGMFIKRMAKGGVADFPEQLAMATGHGVKLHACSTSMSLMNVKQSDVVDGVNVLDTAGFLNIAVGSDVQYFIG